MKERKNIFFLLVARDEEEEREIRARDLVTEMRCVSRGRKTQDTVSRMWVRARVVKNFREWWRSEVWKSPASVFSTKCGLFHCSHNSLTQAPSATARNSQADSRNYKKERENFLLALTINLQYTVPQSYKFKALRHTATTRTQHFYLHFILSVLSFFCSLQCGVRWWGWDGSEIVIEFLYSFFLDSPSLGTV
jgi:hypothetical protein